MEQNYTPGNWKAVVDQNQWNIQSPDGELVALVEKGSRDEANAKLIAVSPMMFEALSGLVQLIGDEDLPDNGELSGAAICDLAREALSAISSNKT